MNFVSIQLESKIKQQLRVLQTFFDLYFVLESCMAKVGAYELSATTQSWYFNALDLNDQDQ